MPPLWVGIEHVLQKLPREESLAEPCKKSELKALVRWLAHTSNERRRAPPVG